MDIIRSKSEYLTPVLFLIFNRPDTTQIVFDKIKEIKPKYLFIAADGPRENNKIDEEKCKEARDIIRQIDWECNVEVLFRDKNLGCGLAVSQAITWFFKNVEYGIILEDDVLVDSSFFFFCESILDLYKDDERVMLVSALNVCEVLDREESYVFSKFSGNIWGWASWRRAWEYYDFGISLWKDKHIKKKILDLFPFVLRVDRLLLYNKMYNKEIDTWDYQWTFAKLLQNGLTIIPQKNLAINIGINHISATHLSNDTKFSEPTCLHNISFPLNHPISFLPDSDFDRFYLYQKYNIKNIWNKMLKLLLAYIHKNLK